MTNTVPCNGKLGFRIHATVFVPAIALLFAINYVTGDYPWAIWPAAAWTIGLAAHWIFGVRKTA
jgi:hypothetical protein